MSANQSVTIIGSTGTAQCQLCGKVDELRPYGPNGESVCFDCAVKDEESAKKAFERLLTENSLVVILPTTPKGQP